MQSKLASRKAKNILVVFILFITLIVFVSFFARHPEYLTQLRQTNPWWIIAVIILNIPMIILLVLIYGVLLRFCAKRIPISENFMLTSYSSIINFFGPLQSGPGVRATYLKTRHKVRLRDYGLATLIYYGIFACFSALFLLAGNLPWWQMSLVLIIVAGISYWIIKQFMRRDKNSATSQFHLKGSLLAVLIIFCFLQVLLTAITYFVELKAVNPDIGWGQAVSYAGAANFALFVSLTPDAIGFREAFLVFSQRFHHVSTPDILSANVIDRGAYLIFLSLLAIIVLSVHVKSRLRLS
ncbi:MAG TPA: lysylphosphatidylglycerol synthase domain-containing protein [Candidatus Saccharimonadales bacterium]|nr:lysylphosphatidylglycerol synthase domain-containing protein [Candidatus Saccharimonadales bacterium]